MRIREPRQSVTEETHSPKASASQSLICEDDIWPVNERSEIDCTSRAPYCQDTSLERAVRWVLKPFTQRQLQVVIRILDTMSWRTTTRACLSISTPFAPIQWSIKRHYNLDPFTLGMSTISSPQKSKIPDRHREI